jgi:hypothetical protein
MTRRVGAAICAALLAAGCTSAESTPPVGLAVPGLASANLSLAAAGEVVAAAWGARTESGTTDIYAAISRDAGGTFGAPVLVSGARHDAQLSVEQPPRVAVVPTRDGAFSIVVVWAAKGPTGAEFLTARSKDGGRTFGDVATVPGSAAAGNRGWLSITAQPDGQVAIIWLDHREMASASDAAVSHEGAGHTSHGQADGAARAQLSKLRIGWVDGADRSRELTGGVCYCCKTAVTTDSNGALYTAWRHVYPGNVRDIAFAVSRDGGASFTPPGRVSEDKWVLDGCPENGPAIAVNSAREIHIVWPTLMSAGATEDPTLALFIASSSDGQRFTARHRLPTEGTPYHPQLAINGSGDVLVVWDELRGGQRHIVAARSAASEVEAKVFSREELTAPGSDPAVAAAGPGFVVGWTDTSQKPSRIVIQRRF